MSENIIQFPKMQSFDLTPEEMLEQAKGWDFESVIIIGFEKHSQTVLYTAKESEDKRAWLEMSELLKVMYYRVKGWMK